MIIILPKAKIEAAYLLLVKAVANNLEASHSEAEARDLSTINVNFRIMDFREVHIRAAVINTAATTNPISREINPNSYRGRSHGRGPQQTGGRSHGRANYQNNNNYQYQYYTHDQQTEQYGPPCSLCRGFNHSPEHCYCKAQPRYGLLGYPFCNTAAHT